MTPERHGAVIDRFAAACRADERILAAFIGGSLARGAADEFSDLDLYIVTTDEAHGGFLKTRADFLRQIGEPLFSETFALPDIIFFILDDGTEGELCAGRESRFIHIHSGPFQVLVDKAGLLEGAIFPERTAGPVEQTEALQRLLAGFWHDLSHLITALGRGQLWWAAGQLEVVRGMAVSLARAAHDFDDGDGWDEPYFKLENAMPVEALLPLRATFVPLEWEAIREATGEVLAFFRSTGSALAAERGLRYPVELDAIMSGRLEALARHRN